MPRTQGRRGVNVSAYLQSLNSLSPIEDPSLDVFNPDDDLAMWTDTTFFDFDMGTRVASAPGTRKLSETKIEAIDPTLKTDGFDGFLSDIPDFTNLDVGASFTDFGEPATSVQSPVLPETPTQAAIVQAPSPQAASTSPTPSTSANSAARNTTSTTARGTKRKASSDASATPGSLEEASRLAAEEDKRRRNTAASARFRIKKKQKEQQLEKTAKEMTERVSILEQRIQTLEMENKWLKNLIVEKNGGKSGEEIMTPSILPGNKDGVGTAGANVKREI